MQQISFLFIIGILIILIIVFLLNIYLYSSAFYICLVILNVIILYNFPKIALSINENLELTSLSSILTIFTHYVLMVIVHSLLVYLRLEEPNDSFLAFYFPNQPAEQANAINKIQMLQRLVGLYYAYVLSYTNTNPLSQFPLMLIIYEFVGYILFYHVTNIESLKRKLKDYQPFRMVLLVLIAFTMILFKTYISNLMNLFHFLTRYNMLFSVDQNKVDFRFSILFSSSIVLQFFGMSVLFLMSGENNEQFETSISREHI